MSTRARSPVRWLKLLELEWIDLMSTVTSGVHVNPGSQSDPDLQPPFQHLLRQPGLSQPLTTELAGTPNLRRSGDCSGPKRGRVFPLEPLHPPMALGFFGLPVDLRVRLVSAWSVGTYVPKIVHDCTGALLPSPRDCPELPWRIKAKSKQGSTHPVYLACIYDISFGACFWQASVVRHMFMNMGGAECDAKVC